MKCNATLNDSRKRQTFTCQLNVGHYDVTIPPDQSRPRSERGPGGWHQDGDQVWADHADGATPHDAQAVADVLPSYKASIRFGPLSGPDWESPYEISVTGPAAFVARVVNAAADAFEEDAQR